MMKQEVQKKNFRLSAGGTNRKRYQEVNVIRHYNPNTTVVRQGRHMPEINCYNDFPPTSRYLQLHPVFKFVDNFLNSNPLVNGRNEYGYREKSARNYPETAPRMYTTKTSAVPMTYPLPCNYPQNCRAFCENIDRIRANMNNINNDTNVRLSLKDVSCESQGSGKVQQKEQETESPPITDEYIQQLKLEIKNNKMEFSNNYKDSSYIEKLKDEIKVSKSKYVEEARNLINDLKNEITNYRLAPRKYSASCCDLSDVLKMSTDQLSHQQKNKEIEAKKPSEKDETGDKQLDMSHPLKETPVPEGYKPFETLWQSKGSLASSSEMDTATASSPGLNFEEKLEEANCLIERVRKALKDIGKGCLQNKAEPEQRRISFDAEEPVKECALDCEEHTEDCCKEGVAKKREDAKKKEEGAAKKEEKKTQREEPESKQEEEKAQIEETVRDKNEEKKHTMTSIKAAPLFDDDYHSQVDEQLMEILQQKLNVITELTTTTESDASDANKTKRSSASSEKVERGCSPIKKDLTTDKFSNVIDSDSAPKVSCKQEKSAPCRKKRHHGKSNDTSPSPPSESSSIKSVGQSSKRSSATKPKRLSLQILPPVSIRSGFVIQRTLNLHIKASGSISNENLANNNIGYQEVNRGEVEFAPMCPDDCKDTEYRCKYKVLESIIDKRGDQGPRKIDVDFVRSLDEDALILYKSYQIFDGKKADSSSCATLANRTHNIVQRNLADQARDPSSSIVTPTSSRLFVTAPKNPWELGLYKTISTQVSGTSLEAIDLNVERSPLPSRSPSGSSSGSVGSGSAGRSVKTPSTEVSDTDEIPVKEVPHEDTMLDNAENPETLAKILNMLIDEKADSQFVESSITKEKIIEMDPNLQNTEPEPRRKTTLSTEGSASSRRRSLSSSVGSDRKASKDKNGKADKESKTPKIVVPSSPGSSSSTESSYNVHGSKASDNTEGASLMLKPIEDKLTESKTVKAESEGDYSSDKADEGLQVSLPYTSTDESSKSSASSVASTSSDRMNTITTFIKGLTGTSHEELRKIKSNPSFPKTDLKGWSQTVLKNFDDNKHVEKPDNDEEAEAVMSKRSLYEVALEEVMDSTDYGDKSDVTPKSEKEEPEPEKNNGEKKGKPSNNKVVMMFTEERRPFGSGEGMFPPFAKRKLPFYRRILGRKLEAKKLPTIEPFPLDESVSEGEISCKCSISTGEVHPCKFKNEKMYSPRHIKKHIDAALRKDVNEKSLKVARQRAQYNNWVKFYLEKHKSAPIDDSSYSASPRRSSKK